MLVRQNSERERWDGVGVRLRQLRRRRLARQAVAGLLWAGAALLAAATFIALAVPQR